MLELGPDDAPDPPPSLSEPPDEVDPSPDSPDLEPPPRARLLGVAADARSFLAQPVPLKWTAGGENALRILPPQFGQADGPWSCTPCTTSIVWPQDTQT